MTGHGSFFEAVFSAKRRGRASDSDRHQEGARDWIGGFRSALAAVARLGYVFDNGEADYLAAQLLVELRRRGTARRSSLLNAYTVAVERRERRGADPETTAERRRIIERVGAGS